MVYQIMQIFNYLIMQGYKGSITKLENFGQKDIGLNHSNLLTQLN